MDFPKHCPHRGAQSSGSGAQPHGTAVYDLTSARLHRLLGHVGKAVAGYNGKPCCVPLSLHPMRQALAEGDTDALADLVIDAAWQLNQCAEQCPALPPLFELMRCCQHSDPTYALRVVALPAGGEQAPAAVRVPLVAVPSPRSGSSV